MQSWIIPVKQSQHFILNDWPPELPTRPRRRKPRLLNFPTLLVKNRITNIRTRIPLRLKPISHILPGRVIYLRMRRMRRTHILPPKIKRPQCLQTRRVQRIWLRVLLQRQQYTIIVDDVGVGSGVDHPAYFFFVGPAVAIFAKDGFAGSALGDELLGSDVAVFEVDMAVADAEGVDHAVAVDEDVVGVLGGVLGVGDLDWVSVLVRLGW